MDVDKDRFRGNLFVNFLKHYIRDPSQCNALDVGCKYGALTFELASIFKKVVGIDISVKVLKETQKMAQSKNNIEIKEMNIVHNDFPNDFFDLVIFEGSLEWMGYSNLEQPPIKTQIKALEETKRILKTGGIVYIGIENKLSPFFWLKDPHTKTPLTVILPRFISKQINYFVNRKDYRVNILTYWGYKKLINKIFGNGKILVPLPHYKYLYDVSTFNGKILRKKIQNLQLESLRNSYKHGLFGLKIFSYFSLNKLFSPNFVILCRKLRA